MTNWLRSRPKLSISLGILAGVIILLFVLALKPFSLKETFTPNPAASYEEALIRIETIQGEEANLELHPECATQLQTHGEKTEKVIIFLHALPAARRSLLSWVKSTTTAATTFISHARRATDSTTAVASL